MVVNDDDDSAAGLGSRSRWMSRWYSQDDARSSAGFGGEPACTLANPLALIALSMYAGAAIRTPLTVMSVVRGNALVAFFHLAYVLRRRTTPLSVADVAEAVGQVFLVRKACRGRAIADAGDQRLYLLACDEAGRVHSTVVE